MTMISDDLRLSGDAPSEDIAGFPADPLSVNLDHGLNDDEAPASSDVAIHSIPAPDTGTDTSADGTASREIVIASESNSVAAPGQGSNASVHSTSSSTLPVGSSAPTIPFLDIYKATSSFGLGGPSSDRLPEASQNWADTNALASNAETAGSGHGFRPESVIGEDGRTRITNFSAFPYNQVVRISIDFDGDGIENTHGSGFLISSGHVLTAGHVGFNSSSLTEYSILTVQWGHDVSASGVVTPGTQVAVTNRNYLKGYNTTPSTNNDILLLTLASPLAFGTQSIGLSAWGPNAALDGLAANVVGYPDDLPLVNTGHGMYGDQGHFTNTDLETGHIEYTPALDTFGGQSGSGVWGLNATAGANILYGVHAYGQGTGFTYNGGTAITWSIWDELTDQLEADLTQEQIEDLPASVLFGSGDSDTFVNGSALREIFHGLGGSDTVNLGLGNDAFFGGPGSDTLQFGPTERAILIFGNHKDAWVFDLADDSFDRLHDVETIQNGATTTGLSTGHNINTYVDFGTLSAAGITYETVAEAIFGVHAGVKLSTASLTATNTSGSVFGGIDYGSIDMGPGVLLTTGDGTPATTGFMSTAIGLPGNSLLQSVVDAAFPGAGETRDASYLEFSFDVTSTSIASVAFSLVFASEEYPEYSNSEYVDIAAAFVNGQNFALFNGNASQPLSVLDQNINAGNFIDNLGGGLSIAYDGISSVLTIIAPVQFGTNNILIGLADTGDSVYDSALYISDFEFITTSTSGFFLNVTALIDNTIQNILDYLNEESAILVDLGLGDDEFQSGTGNDYLQGAQGNDTMFGNDGDDVLDGGADNDDLDGGDGNDTATYEAASSGVNVDLRLTTQQNTGGAGLDTLSNIENVTGSTHNDTLTGNGLANILDGAGGTDSLSGLGGNDTYITDGGDTIVEAENGGTDTVKSSISYTLGAHLENLTLIGAAAINGAGNSLTNIMDGEQNSAANVLYGLGGHDYYFVGVGDTVVEAADGGIDRVYTRITYALAANVEHMTLQGTAAINGTGNGLDNTLNGAANTAANILYGLGGNDTYNLGAGDQAVEALNGGTDTVQTALQHTLAANIENLTLTGSSAVNGAGNELNNVLNGYSNTAANTLYGLAGNDTYILGVGDTAVEALNAGIDTVEVAFAHTLAANLDNLILRGAAAINGAGNGLNNVIDGSTNTAANTLYGLAGNDTYILGLGDTAVEALNAGNDTVETTLAHTLAANIEYLVLRGSSAINGAGNGLNNVLNGSTNTAANTLYGLGGNDIYVLGAGDTAVEADNGGTDGVQTALAHTLAANIENLALTGSSAVNGAGNGLNNILNGSTNTAANALYGLAGNDTYILGAGDTAVEPLNAGTDTVQSALSQTLAANVENLTLTGSSAANGVGNGQNNIIVGNSGANNINGLLGNDTLTGNAGADNFIFTTSLNSATNLDTITDFNVVEDKIWLENAIFTQLAVGNLSSANFRVGGSAVDSNDYIVYNNSTGALWYDPNGSGSGGAIQFALLSPGLSLTSANFLVV